jgi:hypothetical protein
MVNDGWILHNPLQKEEQMDPGKLHFFIERVFINIYRLEGLHYVPRGRPWRAGEVLCRQVEEGGHAY